MSKRSNSTATYLNVVFLVILSLLNITTSMADRVHQADTTPTGTESGEIEFEERKPGLMALEWAAWSHQIYCHALEYGTPLVRVLVSFQIDMAQLHVGTSLEESGPVNCGTELTVADAREIRRQALMQDPDNSALIARVYLADCRQPDRAAWCDTEALAERLQLLAPDNAATYLMGLTQPGPANDPDPATAEHPVKSPFNATELALLKRAGAATWYDAYYDAGMAEVHQALQFAATAVPPFSPSTAALSEAAQSDDPDLSEFSDTSVLTLVVRNSTWAFADPFRSGPYDGCSAAAEEADVETLETCHAIAHLMIESSKTALAKVFGRGLLNLRAGSERAETEDTSLADHEGAMRGFITSCEAPRALLGTGSLSGPMPAVHFELWLQDQAALGEHTAMRNAASREYALYPDDFELDPARCRDIRQLPYDVQQELVEIWRATGTESWQAAFAAAAQALNLSEEG